MNTNISKAYWDFDTGEVKCFNKNFISSEELLEFINYKLSNKQLELLEDMPDEYYRLLKENKECLKLYDNDIEILYEGFKFIKFMQNLLA